PGQGAAADAETIPATSLPPLRNSMSASNIVGQKTNTIAARLIGILLLVLSTNAPRALEFTRHNADSSKLNAIAATGRIKAGDSEKLLKYLRTCLGSQVLRFT